MKVFGDVGGVEAQRGKGKFQEASVVHWESMDGGSDAERVTKDVLMNIRKVCYSLAFSQQTQ